MEIFWKQGFHATSMNDLIEATGLQSGSIYAAFQDKHTFFILALEQYSQAAIAQIKQLFLHNKNPLKAIQSMVDYSIQRSTGRHRRNSCFLGNSVLELARDDQKVEALARGHNMQMAKILEKGIEDAIRLGQLPRKIDAANSAWAVICYIQGIRVLGKAGAPAKRLRLSGKHFLKQLLGSGN